MLQSPEYMQAQTRAPDGNVPNAVGAGLDELMRHVPALRPSCIKALVASLKEVCMYVSYVCVPPAVGDALVRMRVCRKQCVFLRAAYTA